MYKNTVRINVIRAAQTIFCFKIHLHSIENLGISLSSGADLTDYFNYGFTEDSWKAYQQRQHVLRMQGQPYHSNNTYTGMQQHHFQTYNREHQINVSVRCHVSQEARMKTPLMKVI